MMLIWGETPSPFLSLGLADLLQPGPPHTLCGVGEKVSFPLSLKRPSI